ncbi:MAG: hypothetical protein K2L59_07915 [Muribaculaceae bacterium]|nr:hypothetical protein [Muribaculaceae bacterium]
MNEYKEIREMIGRWYGGGTTPGEERRLVEFFSSATGLPEDLEAERALFGAIGEVSDDLPAMPEEYSERVASAVEAEMAKERTAITDRRLWRRRVIRVCGAAACLLAGILAVRTLTVPGHDVSSSGPALAVNEKSAVSDSDKAEKTEIAVPVCPPAAHEAIASAAPAPKEKRHRAGSKRATGHRHAARHVDPTSDYAADDTDIYLSEAEEARLLAGNYHVVSDEREAEAIMGSVFARLEGNLAEEAYRVSDINAQYEMEITKLYN